MFNTVFLKELFFVITFILLPISVLSEETNLNSPLGFTFGISKKEAKELINSSGRNILKNEVDSKEIRTILIDGSIVDFPIITTTKKNTRLEFFKDKLMSTSLLMDSLDKEGITELESSLLAHLKGEFGEPSELEHVLTYKIWSWKIQDIKLLLSSNSNKGEIKLEYSYQPIMEARYQKEMSEKRKEKKVKNPADQMFKDADYSKPRYNSNF